MINRRNQKFFVHKIFGTHYFGIYAKHTLNAFAYVFNPEDYVTLRTGIFFALWTRFSIVFICLHKYITVLWYEIPFLLPGILPFSY